MTPPKQFKIGHDSVGEIYHFAMMGIEIEGKASASILFYKECLVNISRHSEATRYTTELRARPDRVQLIICDNGRGMDVSEKDDPPASLKRRAKLLGAKVSVRNPPEGGTCIQLNVKTRKWEFRKQSKNR